MRTELEKKILRHSILSIDDFIDNIYECGLFIGKEDEIIRENVNARILDLRKDWTAILQGRDLIIPQDDLQFVDLVFSQPDYKNRSQREAKTTQQILNEAKEAKILELKDAYTIAQNIKVINGHTFLIPLKGDFYNIVINQKVTAAISKGSSSLEIVDVNGSLITLNEMPLSKWKIIHSISDTISFSNFSLKNKKIAEIEDCNSLEDLEEININVFPEIQEINLE